MPEYCTCGARLPEDARFCHKCGKDQRPAETEVEVPSEPLPQAAAVATPPPAPVILPITLSNRYVVRAAVPAGIAAFFLSSVAGALGIVALIAGGFFAVYLYRRGTGQPLSISNGLKLGGITGLFMFVMVLISFTASIALEPKFFEDLQTEITRRSALPEAEVSQIISLLRTPFGIGAMLFGMFLSSTLPPALGGAVGAKLLGRN